VTRKNEHMSVTRCPCLSGLPYEACCGRLHTGAATAQTAEQLMRSRFSAFAVGRPDYLLQTWHPTTRPATLDLDDDVRWYRLDIIATSAGGPFDTAGVVEFEAHYRSPAGASRQREVSRFTREDGRWLYLDGAV
jgi:SEC-C motif-containing protein